MLNRPYGGFPWIRLPPVAFSSFPNAHNGYGAFEEDALDYKPILAHFRWTGLPESQ